MSSLIADISTFPPGTVVEDAEGHCIGRIKGHEGNEYIEVERKGPHWFVPVELLETKGDRVRIYLTPQEVRDIDLSHASR